MAIPEGATSVGYNIGVYSLSQGIDVFARFNIPLHDRQSGIPAEALDEALRAGADAIVASLAASYPTLQVQHSRWYDCQISGDPWPPPTEEPAASAES